MRDGPGRRLFLGVNLLIISILLAGCEEAPQQWTDPSASLRYYVDDSGSLSFEAVQSRLPQFQPVPDQPVEFSWSASPHWFHLQLSRDALPQNSEQLALVVDTIFLKHIELYRPGLPVQRGGIRTPMDKRAIRHYKNVFPVSFNTSGEMELFFRVEAGTKLVFPLQVWPQQRFFQKSFIDYLGMGLFVGAALIMAGYNLFLAFALRKSAYAFYSLYSLASIAAIQLDSGLLLHTGLPLNPATSVFFNNLAALSALLFFRSFLPLAHLAPRLDQWMLIQAAFAFLLMFSHWVINGAWFLLYWLSMSNILLCTLVCIAAIVLALKHGFHPARWLALALALPLLVFLTVPLVGFGVLPTSAWSPPVLRGVILLELLLFSLALADLYRELKRQRQREKLAHFEEKDQLMRNVHDTVAGDIHTALLQLPGDTAPALKTRLQQALTSARDLAALIQASRQDTEQTLGQAVNAYLATLRANEKYRAQLHVDAALDRLSLQQRLQLYRIFQEWMNNCLRHGQADSFHIDIRRRRDKLLMRIQSNGLGFNWCSNGTANNNTANTMGSGLNNIRFRSEKIAARVRAMRNRAGGTCFVLRAPLQPGE